MLLAVLIAQRGRAITLEGLTSALWPVDPPKSARRNIQLYVHRLRSQLGAPLVRTHEEAYSFGPCDRVDAVHFQQLARSGAQELDSGDFAGACSTLRQAMDMWRGPAYADFLDCESVELEAQRLERLRLGVCERWSAASLELGRYREVADELDDLVRRHPVHEALVGHLMTALVGAGQPAAALEVYARTRSCLRHTLGADPSSSLQQLHQSILRNGRPVVAAPLGSDGRRSA